MNKMEALDILNQQIFHESYTMPTKVFLEPVVFDACAKALGHDTNITRFEYHTITGMVEVIKTLPGVPMHSVSLEFSGGIS